MADMDDVRRIALALPSAEEGNDPESEQTGYSVCGKGFAWNWKERVEPKKPRVVRKDVLAVRVAGQLEKEMLLASDPEKFFTEPHYNGYPAVLVRLPAIESDELAELLEDAWRIKAPKKLLQEFDANQTPAESGAKA